MSGYTRSDMCIYLRGLPRAAPPLELSMESGEFDEAVSRAMARVLRYRYPEAWGPRSLAAQITSDIEVYGLSAMREVYPSTVLRNAYTSRHSGGERRFEVFKERYVDRSTGEVEDYVLVAAATAGQRWVSDDWAPSYFMRDEGHGERLNSMVPLQAPRPGSFARPPPRDRARSRRASASAGSPPAKRAASRGRRRAGARPKSRGALQPAAGPLEEAGRDENPRDDEQEQPEDQEGGHAQADEEQEGGPRLDGEGWQYSQAVANLMAVKPPKPRTLDDLGLSREELNQEQLDERARWNKWHNQVRTLKRAEKDRLLRKLQPKGAKGSAKGRGGVPKQPREPDAPPPGKGRKGPYQAEPLVPTEEPVPTDSPVPVFAGQPLGDHDGGQRAANSEGSRGERGSCIQRDVCVSSTDEEEYEYYSEDGSAVTVTVPSVTVPSDSSSSESSQPQQADRRHQAKGQAFDFEELDNAERRQRKGQSSQLPTVHEEDL